MASLSSKAIPSLFCILLYIARSLAPVGGGSYCWLFHFPKSGFAFLLKFLIGYFREITLAISGIKSILDCYTGRSVLVRLFSKFECNNYFFIAHLSKWLLAKSEHNKKFRKFFDGFKRCALKTVSSRKFCKPSDTQSNKYNNKNSCSIGKKRWEYFALRSVIEST